MRLYKNHKKFEKTHLCGRSKTKYNLSLKLKSLHDFFFVIWFPRLEYFLSPQNVFTFLLNFSRALYLLSALVTQWKMICFNSHPLSTHFGSILICRNFN